MIDAVAADVELILASLVQTCLYQVVDCLLNCVVNSLHRLQNHCYCCAVVVVVDDELLDVHHSSFSLFPDYDCCKKKNDAMIRHFYLYRFSQTNTHIKIFTLELSITNNKSKQEKIPGNTSRESEILYRW